MCGIAGIISLTPPSNLKERIESMQRSLQHRGPDDRGIYISNDRYVALAHTRLAILDLTSAGHQPMTIDGDRYWITFNGEIYNFLELRQQLEAQGEKFTSHTDTEVILRLYRHKGKNCVYDLRGMFAFAIWDDYQKTVFLARDALGIKPLFYSQLQNCLVFASEVRAILASQLVYFEINPIALYGYFCTGSVPEPLTLITNVQQLPAGHYLEWQNGEISQTQYWQMDFTPDNTIDEFNAKIIVRNALIESVQSHFISDVPIGIFLSGGIDSTAILALARKTLTTDISTYSIGFEETQFDERSIARKTAEFFETDHHEEVITAGLGKVLFNQYLLSLDQPSIDGLNTFAVAKLASQNNKKVVLSGLGGDELFAGYGSFKTIPKMMRYHSKLAILKIAVTSLSLISQNHKLKRLADFVTVDPTVTSAYQTMRGIFSRREAKELVSLYCQQSNLDDDSNYSKVPTMPQFLSIEDQVSYLEISRYMRNQLLRDSDVMSMRCGLELRVPFVDKLFVEKVLKIPAKYRLNFGKKLLIQSVPEIPEWVVNRPKQGFTFPFQQWIDKDWMEDTLHITKIPRHIPQSTWYRKWLIVVLNNWLREIG